ncbi:MAG: hypothetical protein IJI49_03920 [Bacilli bacterium]|nr:hypothetical protein [Bacilli bacterium]
MKLIYNNKEISVTNTYNETIMKYKYQKLYYAIIINECNSYSSIQNKQRIDVIMTDENYKILSIKKEMHENTIFENENATKTILLPLDTFKDLKINTYFTIKE